jgi:uncharacterized protein HemX
MGAVLERRERPHHPVLPCVIGVRHVSGSEITAIVSAVIAALGLSLAAIQYLEARRRTQTERERLAAQEERLKTAVTAATLGVESADLIVQRAKEDDATLAEIQNIARVLRGSLSVLEQQLHDEGQEVAARAGFDRFVSARPENLNE